jgi:hypothetical protein
LGVPSIYEAWIFEKGASPVCVVFTELPQGFELAEKSQGQVQFDGYFFKIYRYPTKDRTPGNRTRDVPLLIGRTLTLVDPKEQRASQEGQANKPGFLTLSGGSSLLFGFFGLIIGTLVLALFLTIWFRRGDQRVRKRLAETMTVHLPEPDLGPDDNHG